MGGYWAAAMAYALTMTITRKTIRFGGASTGACVV
jgi:hypothetical protein